MKHSVRNVDDAKSCLERVQHLYEVSNSNFIAGRPLTDGERQCLMSDISAYFLNAAVVLSEAHASYDQMLVWFDLAGLAFVDDIAFVVSTAENAWKLIYTGTSSLEEGSYEHPWLTIDYAQPLLKLRDVCLKHAMH